MNAEKSVCGSCGAPIWWLKHERTGKPAPIDFYHNQEGNIIIALELGVYAVAPKAQAEEMRRAGEPLHTNHFMTCPQSKTWRKAGKAS